MRRWQMAPTTQHNHMTESISDVDAGSAVHYFFHDFKLCWTINSNKFIRNLSVPLCILFDASTGGATVENGVAMYHETVITTRTATYIRLAHRNLPARGLHRVGCAIGMSHIRGTPPYHNQLLPNIQRTILDVDELFSSSRTPSSSHSSAPFRKLRCMPCLLH